MSLFFIAQDGSGKSRGKTFLKISKEQSRHLPNWISDIRGARRLIMFLKDCQQFVSRFL